MNYHMPDQLNITVLQRTPRRQEAHRRIPLDLFFLYVYCRGNATVVSGTLCGFWPYWTTHLGSSQDLFLSVCACLHAFAQTFAVVLLNHWWIQLHVEQRAETPHQLFSCLHQLVDSHAPKPATLSPIPSTHHTYQGSTYIWVSIGVGVVWTASRNHTHPLQCPVILCWFDSFHSQSGKCEQAFPVESFE